MRDAVHNMAFRSVLLLDNKYIIESRLRAQIIMIIIWFSFNTPAYALVSVLLIMNTSSKCSIAAERFRNISTST
jgi:hypothetical protein